MKSLPRFMGSHVSMTFAIWSVVGFNATIPLAPPWRPCDLLSTSNQGLGSWTGTTSFVLSTASESSSREGDARLTSRSWSCWPSAGSRRENRPGSSSGPSKASSSRCSPSSDLPAPRHLGTIPSGTWPRTAPTVACRSGCQSASNIFQVTASNFFQFFRWSELISGAV